MGELADGGVERQIIAFTLSHEAFGIDITRVERIAPRETITRVPRTPGFISGIMNLAGRIITLIDLAQILQLKREDEVGQQIIILNHEEMNVGFITGLVTDVITTDDESLSKEIVRLKSQEENFVSAILNPGDRIINILDIEKLFEFIKKSFVDSRGK
jgi:purine-binding chemotaxis protein CheW